MCVSAAMPVWLLPTCHPPLSGNARGSHKCMLATVYCRTRTHVVLREWASGSVNGETRIQHTDCRQRHAICMGQQQRMYAKSW